MFFCGKTRWLGLLVGVAALGLLVAGAEVARAGEAGDARRPAAPPGGSLAAGDALGLAVYRQRMAEAERRVVATRRDQPAPDPASMAASDPPPPRAAPAPDR